MFLSRVACATDRTENFLFSPSGSTTVHQAPVVQKGDSAIHWINIYPRDNAKIIIKTYATDINIIKEIKGDVKNQP